MWNGEYYFSISLNSIFFNNIVFILIILGLVFGIIIHNKDKEKEEIPTGATTEVIGTTLDEDGLEAEGFQEENTDFRYLLGKKK